VKEASDAGMGPVKDIDYQKTHTHERKANNVKTE
jgi:hypothetical protein